MKASDLKAVVNNANKIINKKNSLSQLNNVKIEGGFLSVSDLETTYSQKIDIDENIKTLINFSDLEKIVKKAPKNSNIDIDTINETFVKLHVNKNTFSYRVDTVESFNETLKDIQSQDFENIDIFTHEMIKELKNNIDFVSKDEFQPILCGILLDDKGLIVSSDSHLLRFKDVNHKVKGNIILPAKLVKSLSIQTFAIYESEKYVMFANENEVYTVLKMTGHYPNWRAVLPENSKSELNIKKDGLIEQINLAEITANQSSKLVQLLLGEENYIYSQDIDFDRSYKGILNAKLTGDNVDIGFNSEKLLKAIKSIKKDSLKIEIRTPDKGAIINNEVLIMPMKIK